MEKNPYNQGKRVLNSFRMKSPFYHDSILQACSKRHLTVDEIFEMVKESHPRAGFSTIYRNVEELSEKGELRKLSGIGTKALFERRMDSHVAHFVDKKTGKVYDLPLPESLILQHLPSGFSPESVDVRIYGTAA